MANNYSWLLNGKNHCSLLRIALPFLGLKETPGPANTPDIMEWAKEVGVDDVYKADATPWCGLFMAVVCKRASLPYPATPLWARAWANVGVGLRKPVLGAIAVFERTGGGGHVGICVGEDDTTYHILGGNQSDAVTITRIERSRLLAARWVGSEPVGPSVRLAAQGTLSTNEA